MSIRAYLSIVSVLLLISIGAGVYVWYLYQKVQTQDVRVDEEVRRATDEAVEGTAQESTTTSTGEIPGEQESKPLVLTADSLTPEQQKILKAFGMGDAKVVIDDALLACVSDAIGGDRLSEITDGSAPTPLEAFHIAACL